MNRKLAGLVAGLVFAFSATVAHAIPWVLSGVTFDDGGTAYGTFDYNADTDILSNINITTTAGTALSGTSYIFEHPYNSLADNYLALVDSIAADLTGITALVFDLTNPMTNGGGSISLSGRFEGICSNSSCSMLDSNEPYRFIDEGSITSSVPEPTTLALMGLGLAGIGWKRRKAA